MANSAICPVCNSALKNKTESPGGRDAIAFSCPLCGNFVLSGTLVSSLANIRKTKDADAKISHALRTMQQINRGAELDTNTVSAILKRPLPKPKEQADLFIRWLAENVEGPGETVSVRP
ncbi:MAG: hypothetical protein MUF82_00610, partial [Bacteroidetes bacterium]|nr:hypothetical protein [Bacteroidota bacterium]